MIPERYQSYSQGVDIIAFPEEALTGIRICVTW